MYKKYKAEIVTMRMIQTGKVNVCRVEDKNVHSDIKRCGACDERY